MWVCGQVVDFHEHLQERVERGKSTGLHLKKYSCELFLNGEGGGKQHSRPRRVSSGFKILKGKLKNIPKEPKGIHETMEHLFWGLNCSAHGPHVGKGPVSGSVWAGITFYN